MNLRSILPAAALLGVGFGLVAGDARAQGGQTAYAIANGGSTLITFNTSAPGAASAVGSFGGAATALDAIDFRPLTGQLFGYRAPTFNDPTAKIFLVNTANASLSLVGTFTGATAANTNLLGMDFNPLIDRFRVVTDSTQNLVYDPSNVAAPVDAVPLFYPAGDPGVNAPLGPRIIENAYTNNIAGAFGTTVQFGIDYGTDTLVTIANNAGTLTTVGSLGVNVNDTLPFAGFDIFTALGGVNTAYAVLDTTVGNAPTFYNINLTTGAATSVGAIGGGFTQVYSLAVTPTPGVAPEPSSAALGLLTASGYLLSLAVRRRKGARA